MSVKNLSTANPNGISIKDLRDVAASALYLEYFTLSDLSLSDIVENHHKPGSGTSPSFQDVVDISRNYRTVRIQKGNNISSIQVTSPLGSGWISGGEADSTTNSYLYLKAISYDTYSSVSVKGNAVYGYSSYRWRNGGPVGTIINSFQTYTLFSTTATSLTNDTLYVEAF